MGKPQCGSLHPLPLTQGSSASKGFLAWLGLVTSALLMSLYNAMGPNCQQLFWG